MNPGAGGCHWPDCIVGLLCSLNFEHMTLVCTLHTVVMKHQRMLPGESRLGFETVVCYELWSLKRQRFLLL